MKKKFQWKNGDVFIIPMKNNKFAVAQVLDLQTPNTVRCAIFSDIVEEIPKIDIHEFCKMQNLISLIACSTEHLDNGYWKIIDNKRIEIPFKDYPNEKFRKKLGDVTIWTGSTKYSAPVVDSFVNAFHALSPWDDSYDPYWNDALLIDKTKKPHNLIYIKK